jgi:exodeoxyribonuclease V alpha subunit
MTDLLGVLCERGVLAPIDVHMARALGRLGGERREAVLLAAALVGRATREGHVCLDLADRVARPLVDRGGAPIEPAPWPAVDAWLSELGASPLTRGERSPLALDARGRLYLRRYWDHERRLAELLLERVEPAADVADARALRARLDELFGPLGAEPDLQRLAAVVALRRRLCVISGGPGTGKTSTVVKILALLVGEARRSGDTVPRIALAAPTGKAAARLSESIRHAKATLRCDPAVLELVPEQATTIHRLLGAAPGVTTRFRHDAASPLPIDVLLVDEASMIDLALLRRLVEATPSGARVILLGDRDQLASIETGTVLGDLCGPVGPGAPGFSRAFAAEVAKLSGDRLSLGPGAPRKAGMGDCVVELVHSHRFPAGGGIARLAAAIRRGDRAGADLAVELLREGLPDVALAPPPSANALTDALRAQVLDGYRAYLEAGDDGARLEAFGRFRVLCAHRRGPAGVESLNARIEAALADAKLLPARRARFYPRRPLLVGENAYDLRRFNGDIGLVVPGKGSPLAAFADERGGLRFVPPARLPQHETVFAMTVHKAQGSQFCEVAVVLPDERSPVLSRELLYTAVTRPEARVVIHGSAEALRAAIMRPIRRASGLGERMWGA